MMHRRSHAYTSGNYAPHKGMRVTDLGVCRSAAMPAENREMGIDE